MEDWIKNFYNEYTYCLYIFLVIIILVLFYSLINYFTWEQIDKERVNFYLGELSKYDNININKFNSVNSNIGGYRPKNNITEGKVKVIEINDIEDKNDKLYNYPFIQLLKDKGYQDRKFMYNPGDIYSNQMLTTFVKDRITNNGVILRSLNFNRHWWNYYNKPRDLDFNIKLNKIVWRGVSTGREDRKGNRFDLVKKWFNKNDNIDVAFSGIVQGKYKYNNYVNYPMDIESLLKYKYILSVEGNDKDSGLNWKLNSNSLILMPKPTVTSWLMETKLIPMKHYVLIKDDFSDLEEKYNWCNNNQEECLKIISNANKFMEQFQNDEYEKRIEKEVLDEYFKRVRG